MLPRGTNFLLPAHGTIADSRDCSVMRSFRLAILEKDKRSSVSATFCPLMWLQLGHPSPAWGWRLPIDGARGQLPLR